MRAERSFCCVVLETIQRAVLIRKANQWIAIRCISTFPLSPERVYDKHSVRRKPDQQWFV